MNSTKLAPALLLIPLALTTLACPTRPIGKDSGSGGAGGEAGFALAGADGNTGGQGGTAAGSGGVAGNVAGHGGGAAGEGGEAGSGASVAGAAGGAAGAAGGLAGVAGSAAGGAGSLAGAAGGAAGAAGTPAGATGGTTGLGGTAGTSGGLTDGRPCSVATNCASQVCTAFYVDVDGDGYGTGQAVGFCGTTAPVGYASQSGDCCDSATNLAVAKLIHPGADYQTTSAGGVCGITWDYNCSGATEQSLPTAGSCEPAPSCAAIFAPYPDSDCGQSVASIICKPNGTDTACVMTNGLSGTLGCK